MKKIVILIVLLALVAVGATASPQEAAQPNNVAHGAEKQTHEAAHPAEPHGEEGKAEGGHHERTYFGIPGWILKLVNLIVFIGLLAYFLVGPIKRALADRRVVISTQLAEAEARRRKSDQLASDIQARLSQIQGDVDSILQRAREEGERQKQEIIAAAETEAQKIMHSAHGEVEARLKAAREELTSYARELATERAHQLLQSTLTEDDRKRLFAESVEKIGGAQA